MSNGLINNHNEFCNLFEKGQVDIVINKYKTTELVFLAKKFGAKKFTVNIAVALGLLSVACFLGSFLMLIFTDNSFFNKLFIFIGMFAIAVWLTKASQSMKNDIIVLTMLSDPYYFKTVQLAASIAWVKTPAN